MGMLPQQAKAELGRIERKLKNALKEHESKPTEPSGKPTATEKRDFLNRARPYYSAHETLRTEAVAAAEKLWNTLEPLGTARWNTPHKKPAKALMAKLQEAIAKWNKEAKDASKAWQAVKRKYQ